MHMILVLNVLRLKPVQNGLSCNETSCVIARIKYHIFVGFGCSTWFLQDSFHRYLLPILLDPDRFHLQIRSSVVWVYLHLVLITQVCTPRLDILHEKTLFPRSDVCHLILTSELVLFRTQFLLQHNHVPYLEWNLHLSGSHIVPHDYMITRAGLLSFLPVYLPIDVWQGRTEASSKKQLRGCISVMPGSGIQSCQGTTEILTTVHTFPQQELHYTHMALR